MAFSLNMYIATITRLTKLSFHIYTNVGNQQTFSFIHQEVIQLIHLYPSKEVNI